MGWAICFTCNAVSSNGLTRDHLTLNDDGSKKDVAGYTAPSKENLHIGMMAKILDQDSLAWNFVIDYALQNSGLSTEEQDVLTVPQLKAMAEEEALRRLGTIIGEYERYREDCPGLVGSSIGRGLVRRPSSGNMAKKSRECLLWITG